jgi:hypothetical protein
MIVVNVQRGKDHFGILNAPFAGEFILLGVLFNVHA